MAHTPHVLAVTSSTVRRTQVGVYAAETGVAIHHAATTIDAAHFWASAPLVVIDQQSAARIAATPLPVRTGPVYLLADEHSTGAWAAALAAGADHTIRASDVAWLLDQFRATTFGGALPVAA